MEASWFSSAIGVTKSILSAPGKLVGWGLEATVGQAATGFADPTIESFANRFKGAANAVADHATADVKNVLDDELKAANAMASDRINQIDKAAA